MPGSGCWVGNVRKRVAGMKAYLWLRAGVVFVAKRVEQSAPLSLLTERFLNGVDHLGKRVALRETRQSRRVHWCARLDREGDGINQRHQRRRAWTHRNPHRQPHNMGRHLVRIGQESQSGLGEVVAIVLL